MPIARIEVPSKLLVSERSAIGKVVYEAMVAVLNVPEGDNFQIITSHAGSSLVIDPNYLGIKRSKRAVIIQITLNAGRTDETKKEFYRAVADGLHARIGMRPEDVLINLVEVPSINWSFGNGEAQYDKAKKTSEGV